METRRERRGSAGRSCWRTIRYRTRDVSHSAASASRRSQVPPGAENGCARVRPPRRLNPPRPTLWLGSWDVEVTGELSAKMTSGACPATGVQLTREFVLAEEGAHLSVRQAIRNVSDVPKQYFHWSRSFAHGGGKVVVPLSQDSRYPSQYIQYGPGGLLTAPADPAVVVRDDCLEIVPTPQHPKLGIDSHVRACIASGTHAEVVTHRPCMACTTYYTYIHTYIHTYGCGWR
jgi:hypothetical protein